MYFPPIKQSPVQLFFTKGNVPYVLLAAATLVMAILAVVANGTGDDGDSVYHFLFARYAFEHPANFFNHWAKPIFTMIAAPFAQMGFTAVKLMNVALWGGQVYCSIRIAQHFGIKTRWLLPVFAILAPMNVTHTLSGLTEPMFAASFAWALLLLLQGRAGTAYLVFSFLPFIRSEGLILLCVLVLYLLYRRQYAYMLLLPIGHICMSVAGYWLHKDYWWVFNKMTYRGLHSAYGSGPWDHFISMLPSIIGIALCLMLISGLIYGLFKLILSGLWLKDPFDRDEAWLVYGMFLAFFFAHTLFWWKGMFNSFGMLRVMLGIMPAILLICLRGWNLLAAGFALVHRNVERVMLLVFLAGLAWSFFGRLRWDDDFSLNAAEISLAKASAAILEKFPDQQNNVYYLEAYAAALPLDLDIFNGYRCRQAWRLYSGEPVPPNSIVIYDDWFFGHEGRVPLERLKQDKRLVFMGEFEGRTTGEPSNKSYVFYVNPDSIPGKWVYSKSWDTLSQTPLVVDIGGRRALKIDAQQPFSPAFDAGLESFPENSRLAITFDAYCQNPGSQMPGLLVFNVESDFKAYDWRGRPLKIDSLPANTWHTYRFVEQLPRARDEKDKIGTTIWNEVATPVYISNFKVEVLPE